MFSLRFGTVSCTEQRPGGWQRRAAGCGWFLVTYFKCTLERYSAVGRCINVFILFFVYITLLVVVR